MKPTVRPEEWLSGVINKLCRLIDRQIWTSALLIEEIRSGFVSGELFGEPGAT